jgi:hypothetical protein
MLVHDKKKWPGGKMCGFILWIRERWNVWAEEAGEIKNGSWGERQHKKFDKWLQESLA